jgi:hypothetical protein
MRNNREYQICKDIAVYLRLQYPNIIFHFDLAGLNLSRAQAGMMKGIQGGRGWPDLFIVKENIPYRGLFIEIKAEGTKLYKKDRITSINNHISEQRDCMSKLIMEGYDCYFGIGFDNCKYIIDNYLK